MAVSLVQVAKKFDFRHSKEGFTKRSQPGRSKDTPGNEQLKVFLSFPFVVSVVSQAG